MSWVRRALELFWPGFPADGLYKFRVHGAGGATSDRADPMAFATEIPPQTASWVTSSSYTWNDGDWMTRRAAQNSGVRTDEHLRGAPDVLAARPPATDSWPPSSPNTLWNRALPTSSCCRWPSTRSAGRGDIRSPRTTHRRPGWVPPTIFDIWWIPCTGPDRGDRGLGSGPLPEGRLGAGPFRRNPAVRAPDPRRGASARTGAPTFSTSADPRCATSWSPTRCTGWRNITSTA